MNMWDRRRGNRPDLALTTTGPKGPQLHNISKVDAVNVFLEVSAVQFRTRESRWQWIEPDSRSILLDDDEQIIVVGREASIPLRSLLYWYLRAATDPNVPQLQPFAIENRYSYELKLHFFLRSESPYSSSKSNRNRYVAIVRFRGVVFNNIDEEDSSAIEGFRLKFLPARRLTRAEDSLWDALCLFDRWRFLHRQKAREGRS